ncbi:hypothetical protein N0V83_008068 [Neocucurbitaria cava]|uniref:Uncharacterized protein n=1 Tax=Neocucurbitaria cava TaxID=798079 RepID=A0A9W8Y3H4_9PLEO|nr:hypothetical protein N0V83_008068 [Neocucurbitaria cava]
MGSLGSSWGDADYSSDEGGSIHSASDGASEVDLEDFDQEVAQEQQDVATPLQSRRKQASNQAQSTPTSRTSARHSQTLGSANNTPRPAKNIRSTPSRSQHEPSFIMPSMNNSPNEHFNGSPMRTPQVRQRKMRQSTSQDAPNTSPRVSGRKASMTARQPEKQEQEEVSPWHYVSLFLDNVVVPLLRHLLDIFSYALRNFIKPILGVALGIGILFFALQMVTGMLRSSLSNAILGPVCLIPGSSYIIPSCATTPYESQQANFEELINVQTRFEDILDASKDTSTLPSTIKNSELAIRDLRTLVKYSKLPSRHELENEFEYFVQTAAEASQDLSRYNSRIGAAMDRVIATNTWTMTVLSGLSEKEASIGSLTRVFNSLTGAFVSPPPTLQQQIFDQYVLHVSKNKEEISSLIETAQALLMVLHNLDGRLGTIYEIATNDDHSITRSQEELLSSLWTKLGGNRKDVKANNQQLLLLKNISAYRKKAVMHVSETLLKLQEIQAELENLREGVGAPEVLGWRDKVPLTYHLDLIEKGVERLRVCRGEYEG